MLAKCLYAEAVKIGVQTAYYRLFAVISMLFPYVEQVCVITAASVPN